LARPQETRQNKQGEKETETLHFGGLDALYTIATYTHTNKLAGSNHTKKLF
jgi:hypothetical protein